MGHGSVGGNSRLLVKIKRFLGTLLHFGCDISPDVGDRVRTLVFSLVVSFIISLLKITWNDHLGACVW